VTAVAVRISPSGLLAIRERFGIDGPVVRYLPTRISIAA
jgi:hypothetical protein